MPDNQTNPTGSQIKKTERNRVKRAARRGSYDRDLIYSILDAGMVCHIGFYFQGSPFVIPTAYGRLNDQVYIHGAPASRMLQHLSDNVELSFCVTLLDGLVLARSAFHHSMNYRSVIILGMAELVQNRDAKNEALRAFTNHVWPNRWKQVRVPTTKELDATTVLTLPICEASAKVRTGGPNDDTADMHLPIWAGQVPFQQGFAEPIPANDLAAGTPDLI